MVYPRVPKCGKETNDFPWIPVNKLSMSNDVNTKKIKMKIGDKLKFGKKFLKVLGIITKKPFDSLLLPYAYVILIY